MSRSASWDPTRWLYPARGRAFDPFRRLRLTGTVACAILLLGSGSPCLVARFTDAETHAARDPVRAAFFCPLVQRQRRQGISRGVDPYRGIGTWDREQ